jgi:hypothetical protein
MNKKLKSMLIFQEKVDSEFNGIKSDKHKKTVVEEEEKKSSLIEEEEKKEDTIQPKSMK